MSDSGEMRFLVKARAPISGSFALGLTGTDFKFSSEPLFKSVGSVPGLGIGAGAAWHLVTTDLPATTTNQWDVCHQLISGSSSFAAAGVEFAEPDLEQKWPISRSGGSLASFSMREGDPEPQNGRDFPSQPVIFGFATRTMASLMRRFRCWGIPVRASGFELPTSTPGSIRTTKRGRPS
jgi:hypothetical protein